MNRCHDDVACPVVSKCFLMLLCGVIGLAGCDRESEDANVSQPVEKKNNLHAQHPEKGPDGHATSSKNALQNESYHPSPMQADEYIDFVKPTREPITLLLPCIKVDTPPTLDGKFYETVWTHAKKIQTLDFVTQRPIVLAAVHDGQSLYFYASYPDKAPSVTHKSWTWNTTEKIYKQGNDREDMFVIKWSMQGNDIDMSYRNASPHIADVWFWKACRTNPSGYWDDKRHEVVITKAKNTVEISSSDGRKVYLRRKGDQGKQAYAEIFPSGFSGQYLPRFSAHNAQGSRADVTGKGGWENGAWHLEAKRLLDTGHDDDLVMQEGGRYLFGVGLYEMAATGVRPDLTQPLYRCADVFDRIILVIQ